MTLNASGPISLGGSTAGQSVNLELGQSATATISMNDANVRALAGVSSGAISLPGNFWGKSNVQSLFSFTSYNGFNTTGGMATDSSNNIYCNLGNGVAKFSAAGAIQWQKTITNSLGASQENLANFGKDSSGNIYTALPISTAVQSFGALALVSFDSSGALRWQRTITNDLGANFAYATVCDSSNNVYMVGSTRRGTGALQPVNAYIVKYNSSGVFQWQRNLYSQYGSGYATTFYSAACDSSGNIIVAGFADGTPLIAKYNSSGTIVWSKYITLSSGSGSGFYQGIVLDSSDNAYVVGADAQGSVYRCIYAKYDSSGTLQWQKYIDFLGGSTGFFTGLQIGLDSSNNGYVAVGSATAALKYVFSFNSSGTVRWANTLYSNNSPFGTYSKFSSCVIAPNGYLYVLAVLIYNSTQDASSFFAVLPPDGSKTGTYSSSPVGSFTYTTATYTAGTSTNTSAAQTVTQFTPSFTDAAGGLTIANGSVTTTVLNI
jgi:hypothetical protein